MQSKRACRLMAFGILLGSMPGLAAAAGANLLANGGFENVGHYAAYRVAGLVKDGMRFEGADPLLPVQWQLSVAEGSPLVRLVSDAHSGRRALEVTTPTNSGAHAVMSMIELVPGATYSFGAWVKGRGKGVISLYGHAFEGQKDLGHREFEATGAWTEVRGEITVPGNVRTAHIEIGVYSDSDLILEMPSSPPIYPGPTTPTRF